MLAHLKEIEVIRLFKPDGTIVRSSHKGEVGQKIYPADIEAFRQKKKVVLFKDPQGHRSLTLVHPILNRPICHQCHDPEEPVRAILDLHVSITPFEQQWISTRNILVLTGILTLLLMAIVGPLLHNRLIDKPLKGLMKAMEEVQEGDLSTRIEIKSKDDLGMMGERFNSMVNRLQTAEETAEKYHHAQIERAERLASLGVLASGIAHEIRSPLAGISGALQVLIDDFPPQDTKRETLERVEKEVERLNKNLASILAYVRPSPPQLIPSNIHEILEQVLFLAEAATPKNNIHIKKDFMFDLPPALLDPQQIQQVFFNIVLNAMQAMEPQGGTLIISTNQEEEKREKWVSVRIQDNGGGIPPENLENIFSPFFTTKRKKGTGLGLSISQRIVNQHGGGITVENDPGTGAAFIIRLPL
jgi:signal transduction histidine kinase